MLWRTRRPSGHELAGRARPDSTDMSPVALAPPTARRAPSAAQIVARGVEPGHGPGTGNC